MSHSDQLHITVLCELFVLHFLRQLCSVLETVNGGAPSSYIMPFSKLSNIVYSLRFTGMDPMSSDSFLVLMPLYLSGVA